MYHPRQQRSQPFLNAPRPPASQQLNNQPPMDFQFPYPNQLPGEMGSVLGMQGRMDQHQGSGSGISQQRDFGSIPMPLPADNQSGLQQGVNWSSYQPPAKLFASLPPSAGHQGTHLQNQKRQTGAPNWKPPVHDSPLPRTQLSHTAGGGGDSKTLYTPESAGSILASFGLSNEDLEVLSHYPDDQLTPDTLPFILRNIQIKKSGMQKQMDSTSSMFSHNLDDGAGPSRRSSEVPGILTVTQTAGKIIDYGHASQQKYGSDTRKTFKREQLSNASTTRMYPATSSAATPKMGKYKRPILEHIDLSLNEEDYRRTGREKHRDEDYRRMTRDKHRSHSPPGRKFVPSPKSYHVNRDYRYLESKLRSEGSSKLPLSSSSESRPHDSSKNSPTPTMISDFDAVPPKVYPHTCSLCDTNCDQEKDWLEHINTVDHTVACRVLRVKYPDWKPALSSRRRNYRNQASSEPKDDSPFDSMSQSQSRSPSPYSNEGGTYLSRPRRRSYSPRRLPERSHRADHHRFHSPPYSHGKYLPVRERARDHPLRSRTSSGIVSRSGVKRLRRGSCDTSRSLSSSAAEHSSKHDPLAHSTKTVKRAPKPGAKTTKSVKPPLAKKKKVVAADSKDSTVAGCLVYMTGIPKDATEQEVTDMVGSFGKINNVVLMPCSEEDREKGQTASVCMMRAMDALAFVAAPNLCIREQKITASVAKKPEAKQLPDTDNKPDANPDKKADVSSSAGGDAIQMTSDQSCKVLITGLPESGWSETDIIQLVQPFGNSFDIILSTNARKALVSLADLDVAQEMVKVHSFKSAMVNNTEVKLSLLKQNVGLSTPVALYNLFMGSVDPLENVAPIVWNRLLVIKNVPDTPSGSSEVVKLVQRFGKVKRNLVLSTNNMVICEMLTAVRALAVYKRFLKFPCIIQNNPLFFSRNPDPKPNAHTKVIAAYCDSSEVKPVSDNDSQAAAEAPKEEEEEATSEISAAPAGNSCDEKSVETSVEDKSVEQTESKDDKTGELGVSESSAVLDTEPHSDSPTEPSNVLAAESETTEVSTEVENMEATPVSCEVTSQETGLPQPRTITQAMVDTLLEECRATRSASKQQQSDKPAAALDKEQKKTQQQPKQKGKAAIKKKVLSKGATEKQEVVNKQEAERKEKEEGEKEEREKENARREKERAERAKRIRERRDEERERREEERRERERREEERRERERREEERERRDRKRGYGEHQPRSRLDRYRQSSRRDERSGVETKNRTEDEEDFPFNMSDFVTVDEVGDVAEHPCFLSPTVHEETSQDPSVSPKPAQQDVPEDKPVESTVTQELSNEKILESEPVSILTVEEPGSRPEQDLRNTDSSLLASQDHCVPSEAPNLSEAPGSDADPEKGTLLAASLDSTSNTEPLLTSAQAPAADSSSDGLAASVVTTKSEDEKESGPVLHSLTRNEKMEASDSHEQEVEKESGPVGHDVVQSKKVEASHSQEQEVEKESGPVSHGPTQSKKVEASDSQKQDVHVEENQKATDKTATGTLEKTEESVNKDQLLRPYDPQTPVGMEYLVPKTGFFCNACSRFFCGGKVAEIGHCKTLKHYENLKKLLQKAEPESEQTPTA